MKLRLKKLNVEISIGNFSDIDVSEVVGNLLHREATTVPMSELARKIYYDDEVEVSENEYLALLQILKANKIKMLVVTAIEKQVKTQ